MTDPLYRVTTAFTLSQYRDYNRAVQSVNGVYRRIWGSLAIYAAMGAVIWLATDFWPALPLLVALGLGMVWLNYRRLRGAESAQYQSEQLVGTVEYAFFDDRLEIGSVNGTSSHLYSEVVRVIETDLSFLVMLGPAFGAILPKEDCPEGLESFIRSRFTVSHRTTGRLV